VFSADYNLMTPYEGGMTMTKIQCFDIGGNLPVCMYDNNVAQRQNC
jgi:hypothetical protein